MKHEICTECSKSNLEKASTKTACVQYSDTVAKCLSTSAPSPPKATCITRRPSDSETQCRSRPTVIETRRASAEAPQKRTLPPRRNCLQTNRNRKPKEGRKGQQIWLLLAVSYHSPLAKMTILSVTMDRYISIGKNRRRSSGVPLARPTSDDDPFFAANLSP